MCFDSKIEKKEQASKKLNVKTNKIIQQKTAIEPHYISKPAMINTIKQQKYCNNGSAQVIQRKLIYEEGVIERELNFKEACRIIGNTATALTPEMKRQLRKLISDEENNYRVCNREDILESIKKFVRQKAGLTKQEIAAVGAYQGNEYQYWNMNLRRFGKGDTQDLESDLSKQITQIEELISAIDKIKNVQINSYETLHRVVSFSTKNDFDNYLANFIVGQEYVTPQFDSTSIQGRLMGDGLMLKSGTFTVQLRIENAAQIGAEIALVFCVLNDKEKEILLPPFTKYDVLEKTKISPQKYHIILRTKGVEINKIQEIKDFLNASERETT